MAPQALAKRRTRLYLPDGKTPKYIQCWERKNKNAGADRFTVVYTRTDKAGLLKGWKFFVAMNSYPFHPQGIGMHGEIESWKFAKSHGTRIDFADLPEDCRRLVSDDYNSIWRLN